jgi:putative endonuclease
VAETAPERKWPVKKKAPPKTPVKVAPAWCLYLIECRNGALYAGITNDIARRYAQHVAGTGAKYTRANPPLRLIGARPYPDRAAASRAEYAVRKLPKSKKPAFLRG